jgi:hypothetical protein
MLVILLLIPYLLRLNDRHYVLSCFLILSKHEKLYPITTLYIYPRVTNDVLIPAMLSLVLLL